MPSKHKKVMWSVVWWQGSRTSLRTTAAMETCGCVCWTCDASLEALSRDSGSDQGCARWTCLQVAVCSALPPPWLGLWTWGVKGRKGRTNGMLSRCKHTLSAQLMWLSLWVTWQWEQWCETCIYLFETFLFATVCQALKKFHYFSSLCAIVVCVESLFLIFHQTDCLSSNDEGSAWGTPLPLSDCAKLVCLWWFDLYKS